jgi:phosphoribosylamine--glycine ligase
MKVLVVGSGGREHAIIHSVLKNPQVTKVYCAPGNAGIAELAETINIDVKDIEALKNFALAAEVDLTIVGTEDALAAGIVDEFREAGLRIFGPTKAGAELESSKSFAKAFMSKYKVPTAKSVTVNSYDDGVQELEQLFNAVSGATQPEIAASPMAPRNDGLGKVVLKADGLALGKGVVIVDTLEQAKEALKEMMVDAKFGDAGARVVIEEFLEGEEVTVLAFTDGKTIKPMIASQDHKRAKAGDVGPMTGGMGVITRPEVYTESVAEQCQKKIFEPTLKGIKAEKLDYKGVLYFGLMITKSGPKVIEYNCRFGDPETEAILPLLENDLIEVIDYVLDEELENLEIEFSAKQAHTLMLTAGGYPRRYRRGDVISGALDFETYDEQNSAEVLLFHSGTIAIDDKLLTAGGRVLGITSIAETLDQARAASYAKADKIHWLNKTMRKDI